jgi:outer membrane lipoprotein SlyB
MIQGHVSRVKRSGRVKGSSELQLSFEQISLGGRWSDFQAQVIEVVSRGGTGVGDVDEEGGVRGSGSSRDTVTKIGTGTAIGAIIGAIAGGGKGAAIGAAIGGAIGTGGAISSRGSDIRLAAGQELRIRTSNTTRIQ